MSSLGFRMQGVSIRLQDFGLRRGVFGLRFCDGVCNLHGVVITSICQGSLCCRSGEKGGMILGLGSGFRGSGFRV